jgi:stress-induced-phosphoprotein 1
MGRYLRSYEDAKKSTELKPSWSKGYLYQTQALSSLGRLADAKEACLKGLEIAKADKTSESSTDLIADLENELKNLPSDMPRVKIKNGQKIHSKTHATKDENALQRGEEDRHQTNSETEDDGKNESFRGKDKQVPLKVIPKRQRKKHLKAKRFLRKRVSSARAEIAAEVAANRKKLYTRLHREGNEAFIAQDWKTASDKYSTCIENAPRNLWHVYYGNRSQCMYELSNFKSALEDASSTIKYNPNWLKGYVYKVNALIALRNFEEAEITSNIGLNIETIDQEDREKTEKLKSSLRDALEYVKHMEEQKLQHEKMMEEMRIAAKIKHERWIRLHNEGNDACASGDWETAAHCFSGCLTDGEEDQQPLYYRNRAECFIRMKKYVEALADADQALKKDPGYLDAYLSRTHALMLLKRLGQAEETCVQALSVAGNADYNANIRASFREDLEKIRKLQAEEQARAKAEKERAERERRQAEERARRKVIYDSKHKNGNDAFSSGDWEAAMKHYSECIDKCMEDRTHTDYVNRSHCYLELGKPREALYDAQKALTLDPESLQGFLNKTRALVALNADWESADKGELVMAKASCQQGLSRVTGRS